MGKGDDFTIQRLLATRCRHEDKKVRAAALQAVEAIALPGDLRVVDGMLQAINADRHPQVSGPPAARRRRAGAA